MSLGFEVQGAMWHSRCKEKVKRKVQGNTQVGGSRDPKILGEVMGARMVHGQAINEWKELVISS